MSEAISVGLIGLGVMGRPMARYMATSTQPTIRLSVNNRTKARADEAISLGAQWADTPAELAANNQIIILMVPAFPDITALLDGDQGLLAGVTSPTTLVISSTCSPQQMRDLSAELAERTDGLVHLVDAPVSGGEEGANEGSMSIMVGGDDADVAPLMPVFETMGNPVHLGPVGAGQVAKACNQLIVAAEVVANAEAAVIAERAGLDVAKMFDLLVGGYAGSRVMQVKKDRFAQHDHSPSGPAKFMIKDLAAVAEEAEHQGVSMISLDALRTAFGELTEQGMGDYDTAVVQRYIEQQSN